MNLERLLPAARLRLQPAFYSGAPAPELDDFVKPWDRDLDLNLLEGLLNHLLDEHESEVAAATDAWLAPRLHSALRLTRREAAERDIWSFLAVLAFPEYVKARWGGEPGRYFAAEVNQAFSRLWWGAELCRNGSDYRPVMTAFSVQDIPNTWFRLDAFHSRPLAVGLSRLVEREQMTGRQINALATATNISLTTSVLDSIASTEAGDDPLASAWLSESASLDVLLADELPPGPDDETVPDEVTERVVDYLSELLRTAQVRG